MVVVLLKRIYRSTVDRMNEMKLPIYVFVFKISSYAESEGEVYHFLYRNICILFYFQLLFIIIIFYIDIPFDYTKNYFFIQLIQGFSLK